MSEPTCCITGYVAGHPCACGDCDPCGAAHAVSPEVKRLLAEVAEWMQKYEGVCCELDALKYPEHPQSEDGKE